MQKHSQQYDHANRADDYIEGARRTVALDPSQGLFPPYLDHMDRTARILDVGCGFGMGLEALRDKGFRFLTGLDASADQCGKARHLLQGAATILQASFEALPLAGSSVDAVLSRYAFHYASKPALAMGEVARVMKTGGLFMFIVPHPDYDRSHTEWHQPDGTITVPLFGSNLRVTYPRHETEDYVGPSLQSYFNISHKKGIENFDTARTGVSAALFVVARRNKTPYPVRNP